MRSRSRYFLIALLVWAAPVAFGQEPVRLAPVILGFDMEMDLQKIANLIRYIDLPFLETAVRALPAETRFRALSEEVLHDYVLQPAALESLRAVAPKLHASLTQGLKLETGIVLQPTKADSQALRQGRAPQAGPAPERGQQGGIHYKQETPAGMGLDNFRSNGTLLTSKVTDWQILATRWNALPLEVKGAAVRLDRMAEQRVAELIKRLPVEKKKSTDLFIRFREDAPAWTKSLALSLDAGRKGRQMLEIAQHGTEPIGVQYMGNLESVVAAAGARSQVENPTMHRQGDVALHLHMSFPEFKAQGRKVHAMVRSYRRLLLLRLLLAAPGYDALLAYGVSDSYLQNLFDRSLTEKHTILRVVSDDHIEFKEHYARPEVEITEWRRLAAMSEEAALEWIDGKTSELLKANPELETRIARNVNIVSEFESFLGQERAGALTRHALEDEARSGKAETMYGMKSITSNPMRPERFADIAELAEKYPSETMAHFLDRSVFKSTDRPAAIDLASRFYDKHLDLLTVNSLNNLDIAGVTRIVERIAADLNKPELEPARRAELLDLLYATREILGYQSPKEGSPSKPLAEHIAEVALHELRKGAGDVDLALLSEILHFIRPGSVKPTPELLAALRQAVIDPETRFSTNAIDMAIDLFPKETHIDSAYAGKQAYGNDFKQAAGAVRSAIYGGQSLSEFRGYDHGKAYFLWFVDIRSPRFYEEAARLANTPRDQYDWGSRNFSGLHVYSREGAEGMAALASKTQDADMRAAIQGRIAAFAATQARHPAPLTPVEGIPALESGVAAVAKPEVVSQTTQTCLTRSFAALTERLKRLFTPRRR